MNNQALQYYMHDGPSAFRFELAGNIDSDGARRLDQDWRAASSLMGESLMGTSVSGKKITGGRRLIVDMTFVTSAGEEGRALLARWHTSGAQLIAQSEDSRKLAEAILGRPHIEAMPETAAAAAAGSGRTWLPFRTSSWTAALHLIMLLAVLLPVQARAANLQPETVAAWDEYVRAANAALQNRVRPGGEFLWAREDPRRFGKVHGGETVVAAGPAPCPLKVPGGLIHHWIGATFLPGATLDDMLEVTRDYDRYREFYSPAVIASKATARSGSDDKSADKSIDTFSMLLMNRGFLLNFALDADYVAENVRLDDRRFYSVSRTTRVQEIDDYGLPGEHRIPAGEGGGYIWKLLSIARFEQSGDGVFVELETIALSRDIPGAVRVLVDPIVRRVSRNSMLISLKQTENAVRENSLSGLKAATSPVTARRMNTAAAPPMNKTSSFLSRQ